MSNFFSISMSGKNITKDDIQYYEVKEDGAEGKLEEGVVVTINDDAVPGMNAEIDSRAEK